MGDAVLTLTATEFKAKWLAVFHQLEKPKLARVIVTRRGKPVAEVTPPRGGARSLFGCMRGNVKVAPGVDLTEPVIDEPFDAELGTLHR